MSRRMDFRKPRLGEYTTASSLFTPASARGFALSDSFGLIGQLRKGLELDIVLLLKYDGNYNWFDFHTIRKAQMQSCGKTRNISTSLARGINNNKEINILRFPAEKNVEQSCLLEVNSPTLVVGLVDSSLISFLLKLLQR